MIFHTALDILPEPLSSSGVAYMNYHTEAKANNHFRILLSVHNHISPEVVELLNQCGLYIRFAELFYTPANRSTLIHIDGEANEYLRPGNMAKINYVGGGEGSKMHWYEPTSATPCQHTSKNKFISFQPNQVKLISSSSLLGYNIAQTGIPHNITTANEPRYCVSLTLALKGEPPKMIPYEILFDRLSSKELIR